MTTTSTPKINLEQRLVSDVMRAGVVGCTPETPLTEVARLMSEHRIHCVVVGGLEEDRHGTHLVWGVVSDLDLARAAAAVERVTAGQIAATEPVTALRSDSLAGVAQVMGEHDVAHLVVVDDRKEPIGVVSTLDVARALCGS
jgi:CBS domain-containing protein